MQKRFFIRRIDAEDHLETFMMSAVAAVLAIRTYLSLSGYPQLGGDRFHIAHMLWGGLLMCGALLMALSYIGRKNLRAVAVAGGLGFGTFIDELGKFITRDNNYFYQPAVSLIYITMVLLFIGSRSLLRRSGFSRTEYLLNAVEQLEEVAVESLDEDEKAELKARLAKANPHNALVKALNELTERIEALPVRRPGPLQRSRNTLKKIYLKAVSQPKFPAVIIAFFAVKLFLTAATALLLVFFYGMGMEEVLNVKGAGLIIEKAEKLDYVDGVHLAASALSAFFIVAGIIKVFFSRLAAYRAFERAALVDIFITQVFVFYKEQFAAATGLALNIFIWVCLRYMIHREELALKDRGGFRKKDRRRKSA